MPPDQGIENRASARRRPPGAASRGDSTPGVGPLPALLVVLAAVIAVRPVQGRLVGRIVQAGFRVPEGAGCRSGCWLPVLVELWAEGTERFSGRLRLEQPDTDGDRCLMELPVTLVPGSEVARQFWMYCPANLTNEPSASVRLLDEFGNVEPIHRPDGELVDRLSPVYPPQEVDSETTFVLDVSSRALPGLASLDSLPKNPFVHPPTVGSCPPRHLPDRWYGLEMLDAMVWDSPDPAALTGDQIEAIREWVRRGGTLVVSAGKSGTGLASKSFVDLLPAEPAGTRRVEQVDVGMSSLLGVDAETALRPALTASNLRPRPGSRVVLDQRIGEPEQRHPLIVAGRYGFGHVVMCGMDLSDLSRIEEADQARLFGVLLGLRTFAGADPDGAIGSSHYAKDLFPVVRSAVDFSAVSAAYLLIAFLFIVGYILVSTLGTWYYLHRRGWLHHSWSLFAVAAFAGSAVSIGAVQFLRGVGVSVAQLTVVDGRAGSYEAQALCYFGVKTSTHTNLDLWLPSSAGLDDPEQSSPCKLKPIPPELSTVPRSFADPHRYVGFPERARLDSVLFRATLKQFEGQWAGNLSGKLEARLVVGGRQINNESWLANDLGVDLHRVHLLVTALEPGALLREDSIEVYHLGTLRAGERVVRLGDHLLGTVPKDLENKPDRQAIRLKAYHEQWARRYRALGGIGEEIAVSRDEDAVEHTLLLLTTLKELVPESSFNRYGANLARSRCRRLSVTDSLTRDHALLIGFTRQPGPVRLGTRPAGGGEAFDPIGPRTALTMYRLWIPVAGMASQAEVAEGTAEQAAERPGDEGKGDR